MKGVYKLLDGNALVNIPICLILAFVAYRWARRIWVDCSIRWYRPVLTIIGLVVLYYGSNVEYAKVVSCISYRMTFTILLTGMLLVMLVKGFRRLWSNRQKESCEGVSDGDSENKPLGLTGDKTDDGSIPESLKKYAGVIVERLLVTDIKEQSYALGVTGEWGVGKTTFLSELKKNIGNRADIVEFNPWMCGSPEQVTSDFFASLQHQLSGKYSTLSKSIRDYAKYVNNVTVAPHPLISVETLLPVTQESLFERKKALSEKFSKLPKPVVVVIDDVDRLERDEVFEVLRLIRNTADLSNVIYMVAYDKEYVTSVLKEKEIKDAAAYLEKIFPLELSLPKTEEEALIETFRRALIDMHFMGNHDSLRSRMTPTDEQLLVRLLPTYRKIKRFARVLMTNTMFMQEKVGRKNVDLYDMYLIELLHFSMQDVYVILRDRPEEMLEVQMDPGTRQARYVLKKDILSDESCAMLFDRVLGRYEKELVEKCFMVRGGDKVHFLSYVDSYQNYFCLATPDAVITKKEFNDVVIDRSTIRKNVHDWFWKVTPKKSASLYSKMMSVRTKELTHKRWEDHVFLLFSWLCENDYELIKDVLIQFLRIENLHIEDDEEKAAMKEFAQSKLLKMVDGQNVDRFSVARNLSGYCHSVKDRQSDYLLNVEEIGIVLTTNFKKFMSEKQAPQDAINVVAINGNDLNEFVKAHDIREDGRDDFGDFRRKHQNFIIDVVISYFGAYEEKSNHLKDAKVIYEFGQTRYKLPYINVDMKEEKSAVFGNEANYERYLRECFKQSV